MAWKYAVPRSYSTYKEADRKGNYADSVPLNETAPSRPRVKIPPHIAGRVVLGGREPLSIRQQPNVEYPRGLRDFMEICHAESKARGDKLPPPLLNQLALARPFTRHWAGPVIVGFALHQAGEIAPDQGYPDTPAEALELGGKIFTNLSESPYVDGAERILNPSGRQAITKQLNTSSLRLGRYTEEQAIVTPDTTAIYVGHQVVRLLDEARHPAAIIAEDAVAALQLVTISAIAAIMEPEKPVAA